MILEAFQGAIVRNADGLLHFAVGYFVFMTGLAVVAIIHVIRKRRGHQPSSAGERPEPPRTGSGVMAPVDPLARIARLRAELEDLVFIAQGEDRSPDTPSFLQWTADRLQYHHGEPEGQDYVIGLRERGKQLNQALINARRTLEATKPPEPPPSSDD